MIIHRNEELLPSKLYFDPTFDIDAVRILPGGYYATSSRMMLVTTLGSCVAACIRDPSSGIGGMNHFMLPENIQEQGGWGSSSARYGSYAMEMLINQLLKIGARRQNLEAKLFGGGAVIKHMKTINIGARNAEFALDYLKIEGIHVVSTDLLDIYPRKVCYFPDSGKVLVKKLYGLHNNAIINREQSYRTCLEESKVEGDVELFT
ncbi:MAG: hypothetical protein RLZZ419_1660 [Pseudomonadota bacterium]|jgi:chemotaxis protein CheD